MKEPCKFCKDIIESLPSLPLSKLCDFCNRIIEADRYAVRPHIICLKSRDAAIAAEEKAFKVKDKIVIHDVETRTVLDAGALRSGDTCPGCEFKVPDKISVDDAIKAAAKIKTPAIECGDRFPLCLNSAPVVLKNVCCSWCGQSLIHIPPENRHCPLCPNEPDWSNIKFGITQFRSRITQFPQFKLKQEASEPIWITKRELAPPKITPGIKLEELKNGGKDSSTAYQRFHHSTKCNGWARRYSEDEWQELFDSIIRPLTAVELEELVYRTAELDARELKDPKPARKDTSIFDDPIKTYFRALFLGLSEPIKYKKMSLAEAEAWHQSRLAERRECYKNSILHPLPPKPHEFVDPYYRYGFITRSGKSISGRFNPEYWRYDLSHRVGFRGKKKITLDYYKFPAQIGKLEQESTGNISWGRYEMCPVESKCPLLLLPPKLVNGNPKHIDCHIYTAGSYVEGSPGDKKTSFRAGPLERDEFALKLTGDSFTLVSNPLKVPNPHRIAMMGSMVSPYVSQIGQSLNTKEMKRGRIYPLQKCGYRYCDGVLYYRNRGEIVCDKCQTVHDKIIVTTEYMNRIWDDWGEFEKPVTLGKEIARTLNKRDIQARQVGRICADIGCDIFQLQASTVWQHQFLKRFEELYQIHLEHQGIASKIKMFMEKIEVSRY